MDVQTENMDLLPSESQPSGKNRKGFKLFGKRKPGNIFSIRSKGDGVKSPVTRSGTLDGLSDNAASDSLGQELDKEKAQEVSQGDSEQAEGEPLGEDGVLAATPAHHSISSVSSVRSLRFLSILRGSQRAEGDRQVQSVSRLVGRQRRGLKGLFGNVKFRSKDKEEKEEAPPSPLLMSSRADSVEIIKEELTLTPKSQPRSLDSPEEDSHKPTKSLTLQDSSATSPSKMMTTQKTPGDASQTNKSVSPLLTPELPLMPGEKSLSSLLADISSLLTFDSIGGGGDIMADVEAEWGKATEVMPSSSSISSKPVVSSSTPISCLSAVKLSSVVKTSTSPPIVKPSSIITTLTKSSTLTTHSSSDSNSASSAKSTTIAIATTKPSTVIITSLPAPIISSPLIKSESILSSTSTTTAAPPNTSAAVVNAPSVSPNLNSTVSNLASEIVTAPQIISSVSKPDHISTTFNLLAKAPRVSHSPPTTASFLQLPPAKLDSNLQTFSSGETSQTSAAEEFKAPVTLSNACTVTNKLSAPVPVLSPLMATPSTAAPTPILKTPSTHTSVDLNKTLSPLVNVPDICPPQTKAEIKPSSVSVPTPFSASLDKIPPMTKYTPTTASPDKTPLGPTTPTPTLAVGLRAPITLTGPYQTPGSQTQASPAPVELLNYISKELPVSAQIQISQSKATSAPAHIPISVPQDPLASARVMVSLGEDPPAAAQILVSVHKDLPALASVQVSGPKDPPALASIQVSEPKDPSVPPSIPVSVSKDAPAQITISQSNPPSSPPFTPTYLLSEAPALAKIKGGGQVPVDGKVTCLSMTQMITSKTEELPDSQSSLQGPSRERKTVHVKTLGLSKIPVVGGRAGKLPVRDNQHAEGEMNRDLTTPVLEDKRPNFNSHDVGSKDKISHLETNAPTSKYAHEESQQLKVLTSSQRDSKIPVKHGTQSHTASHIQQAKEHPRTKIPVSKVPVRRLSNKPAAATTSAHIRK